MIQNVIMKIKVQRLVEVWEESTYDIPEFNEEIRNKILDEELDPTTTEFLYDSAVDLGVINIYDKSYNLLYTSD